MFNFACFRIYQLLFCYDCVLHSGEEFKEANRDFVEQANGKDSYGDMGMSGRATPKSNLTEIYFKT
jgi:hypothetical protein